MLKIAVCDDTPQELSNIAALAKAYLSAHNLDAEVATFSHPDGLLQASEKTCFDLYLLDIVMPMVNGIDVGKELRRRNCTAQLVYLTTSSEFAVDAFALQAVHYLIKPFCAEQFEEALDRAMNHLKAAATKSLTVKTEGGNLRTVDIDDIQYIESRGHDQQLHLKNEICTETRRSLARLLEELDRLSPGQFMTPYKGYLVNLRAVTTIDKKGILLRCGALVPIPRGALRDLQARYVAYRFDNGGEAV